MRSTGRASRLVARVAEASPPETVDVQISLDNDEDADSTVGLGAVVKGCGAPLSTAARSLGVLHCARAAGIVGAPCSSISSSPARPWHADWGCCCGGCCAAARNTHLQVLFVSGANRPGLLTALSAALRELGLDVSKAIVETDAAQQKIADKFYVTKQDDGSKVTDADEVQTIKNALELLLKSRAGPMTPRPKFTTQSIQQDENKKELLYTLMGA
jgi:hypothetical protein